MVTYILLGCSTPSERVRLTPQFVLDKQQLYKHIETLSSDAFNGRKLGSEGNREAQKYIVRSLQKLNISPMENSYYQNFTYSKLFTNKEGSNIVAVIKGVSKSNNKKNIVLSAHFDHLGRSGNKIFNGADDNASGSAALLSLAQQLVKLPLEHNIILLFSDGEESNLKGAKAFVKRHIKLLADIKLNINMDMLAGSQRSQQLNFISKGLGKLLSDQQLIKLKDIQSNSAVELHKGFKSMNGANISTSSNSWIMASDHGVFHKAHIPFLYFGVGTHKNYHKASDIYKNINPVLFLGAVESIYQQLIFIDKNI